MTAAMLVLEPIFEADLPPEIYAYRAGRNAQQAAVAVEELVFRGHPEVVDADVADYFGSIPHAELMKSVSRRIVDRLKDWRFFREFGLFYNCRSRFRKYFAVTARWRGGASSAPKSDNPAVERTRSKS